LDATVAIEADREFFEVRQFRMEFRRLLINLLKNSEQARAGKIHIVLKASNNSIEMDYEDDGCGFPEEFAKYLNDDSGHFTTQLDKKAHGFGMKIIREFSKKLGGHFELVSYKNPTYQRITFPRVMETEKAKRGLAS